MLNDTSLARLVGAWCLAFIVLGACRAVAGAAITISLGELLLATCLAPPAIMLLVRRGAPPSPLAELLRPDNGPSKEARASRP